MLGACVTNGRQFTQLAHLLALAKLDQNDIKPKTKILLAFVPLHITLGNSRPSSEWNGKQNDNRLKTNNVCRILFRPFCYLLSDSAVDFAVRSWPYSSFAPPPHLPIQPDAATMHACAVYRVCMRIVVVPSEFILTWFSAYTIFSSIVFFCSARAIECGPFVPSNGADDTGLRINCQSQAINAKRKW